MRFDFEMRGTFAQPTHDTVQSKLQFEIDNSPDDYKEVPYWPPCCLSPKEDAELQQQLEKTLHNGWRKLSSRQYGSLILFVPKIEGRLRMCIDYWAVTTSPERIDLRQLT